MQDEINFELTEPFKYAVKGEQEEAKFITLHAPTSRNMSQIAFLKQAFYRALPKGQQDDEIKDDTKKKEDDITGEDIMDILMSSMDVDLSKVLIMAKELFTAKNIAFVDGEEKVTKPILESMHPDDFMAMVGEYLANFTLASVLRKMKES